MIASICLFINKLTQKNQLLCDLSIPFSLYTIGSVLLLFELGSHPPFPYNWEQYTIWHFLNFWDHPSWDIFRLTDGVITDGGKSPLIVLPVWFAFKLGGIGLAQLRIPMVLLTAASIPVFWFIARRISGTVIATLATTLLIISPVFLLYGRTATNVGVSLLPALLTVYTLLRFLQ